MLTHRYTFGLLLILFCTLHINGFCTKKYQSDKYKRIKWGLIHTSTTVMSIWLLKQVANTLHSGIKHKGFGRTIKELADIRTIDSKQIITTSIASAYMLYHEVKNLYNLCVYWD